jgi:hypothetical protein
MITQAIMDIGYLVNVFVAHQSHAEVHNGYKMSGKFWETHFVSLLYLKGPRRILE